MDEKAQKRFHRFVADWLQDKLSERTWGSDDDKIVTDVVSVKEQHKYGGFCETCAYDYIQVLIVYVNGAGKQTEYEFYGSLSDIITGR